MGFVKMVNVLSPLASVTQTGRFGATFAEGPGVTLSESRPAALIQIAGWGDFEDAIKPGLTKLGFDDAGDYHQCHVATDIQLFRTAPDRILLAAPATIILPDSLRSGPSLAVLDLSHSRTRIVVEGPAAQDVMARLAPIDFAMTALPIDGFVQTGIHHVGVLINRSTATRFEILTPVTWARSLWEFICLNAAPTGYQITVAA
jgi:heterotetrameric sarcosine oxidase gamma subunit